MDLSTIDGRKNSGYTKCMAKNITTISSKITKGEELVVIPRSLYEKFSRWEKEWEGLSEYQNASAIKKSYRRALKVYPAKK